MNRWKPWVLALRCIWKRSYQSNPPSCHALCIQGAWGFASPFWPGNSAKQTLWGAIWQLGLFSSGFTGSRARFHLLEKCPCMSYGCGWRKVSIALGPIRSTNVCVDRLIFHSQETCHPPSCRISPPVQKKQASRRCHRFSSRLPWADPIESIAYA